MAFSQDHTAGPTCFGTKLLPYRMLSHEAAPGPVKRERSPSPSYSGDPRRKTPRLFPSSNTGEPSQRCLHCSGIDHTWSKCDSLCLQCWDRHPRKRCPKLAFDNYTPGGFSVLGERLCSSDGSSSQAFEDSMPPVDLKQARESDAQDSKNHMPPVDLKPPHESAAQPIEWSGEAGNMEGVAAERQAMIALTPVSPAAPYRALSQEGGGPLASGINAMPLGAHVPDAYMLGLHPPKGVQAFGINAVPFNAYAPDDNILGLHPTKSAQPSGINAFPFGAHVPDAYMLGLHPATGPRTFGTNAMPQGPRVHDTYAFAPHPAEALRGSFSGVSNKKRKKQSFGQTNKKRWDTLKHQIRDAVDASQDPSAPVNNGRDKQEVDALISRAFNILKPAITRLN